MPLWSKGVIKNVTGKAETGKCPLASISERVWLVALSGPCDWEMLNLIWSENIRVWGHFPSFPSLFSLLSWACKCFYIHKSMCLKPELLFFVFFFQINSQFTERVSTSISKYTNFKRKSAEYGEGGSFLLPKSVFLWLIVTKCKSTYLCVSVYNSEGSWVA